VIVPLRLMLGHAVEDGLIPSNPAATTAGSRQRLRLPAEHREMEHLRVAEIPLYLQACRSRYRPLAEVLIGAGLRVSEALARSRRPTSIFGRGDRRLAQPEGPGRDDGSTKGDAARRVEIGPRLAGVLADHQALSGSTASHPSSSLAAMG
jgi:site-specific recombinase XerC